MGTGQYGEVRKCRNKNTFMPRAAYLLRKDKIDDIEVKRFTHETQVLSKLDHPNILKLYE
jgi:serine/threonine protein kinase